MLAALGLVARWGVLRRLGLQPSVPFFPTASELYRAAECVAPWALGLPESGDEPGEWAERGRRLHAAAEAYACRVAGMPSRERDEGGDLALWADAWRTLAEMLTSDFHQAKPGSWYVEQGIRWRSDGFADEAELCEREPGERLRGWFSGTADLVYVRADGVLVVADWKFGAMEHLREPAEDSCQGFFLALAFCRLLEITGSAADVVVARFEKRIVSEAGIEVDGYDITQGELLQWHTMLSGLAGRIVKAESAAPRLSAACGHCKAKAACPSWDALKTHAMTAMANVSTGQVDALCRPPQSPEDARTLYHAIEQGEHLTAEWKQWLKAYVLTSGPVPIGLGLSLKALPQSKRSVVATPEAMDVIERVAGGAAIEVQRSATCESIKKAVRDAAGEGIVSTADRNKAKARAEENAFAALIAAGAIRESVKIYTVRECRAGETEE